MTKLTVTFLGTSSAAPTRGRGLPAIAIQREGSVILMDCGEGVQRQVLNQGVGLNKETSILITHLHGDHVTGLLGLLQTMSLAQRRKPLNIVGPPKLLKWLEVTEELLHIGLTFPVNFFPAKQGTVLRTGDFKVRATKALHSVEAYSFVVEERRRPGVFFPEKAKALRVPEGRLWSRLQNGRKVRVEGRTISPSEVTGQARPGRKIGYSGDTRPSPRLARFFSGCDLLIFDSTFHGKDREKAVERKHSTCLEAAEIAKSAGVRRLALTHFSARYTSVANLVKQARSVFPETIAARDGLKVEVNYPSS
ncbi:MAG: ribonuclease Z [Nitrososphaerales archaeon]